MVSRDKLTPEKRVGLTANLTIFLGILYTSLSIAAISGIASLSTRGYGAKSIAIGCAIIGLGYGIRYGSKACLYIATAFFWAVGCVFYVQLPVKQIYWPDSSFCIQHMGNQNTCHDYTGNDQTKSGRFLA